MVKRIFAYVENIEQMGGLVKVVENGWLHREISNYNNKYQKDIESGEMKIVGVNYQKAADADVTPIEVFEYPETYTRQKAKLDRLRKERSNEQVQKCLGTLREKCHTKENLYPYCIDAVKSLATHGEIAELFRQEFGLWSFPLIS